ncbi:MAG: translation elongation factor 4 [bacterium]
MDNIRNFVIIAHVDHGKSTLADRFLELTGTVTKGEMRPQFLDAMELERGKGITIKMHPVRMEYQGYILNLIDTPGHVDFSYEVSRSLAAVEGAILLVDATQGIQAQTLANLDFAKKQNLIIIPAINKIDMPQARVVETKEELAILLGVPQEEIFEVSARQGTNVEKLLAAVIEKVPPAKGMTGEEKNKDLRALIFDSKFDPYRGVIAYVRIVDGKIVTGEKIYLMGTRTDGQSKEVGYFKPELKPAGELKAGEIGYIATGVKEPGKIRVGDTIINLKFKNQNEKLPEALVGYHEPKPMVFASLYPENPDDFDLLKTALAKLRLNDSAFTYELENKEGLGRGYRGGFLGTLHAEIISERLRREFGLNLIISSPSVVYKILNSKDQEVLIYSPSDWPNPSEIKETFDPWVRLEIISPINYLGPVSELLKNMEFNFLKTEYLGRERIFFFYEAPLRRIIAGFYDGLKSVSQGYASMNYELLGYRPADLIKLDILIAGKKEDVFAKIVDRKDSLSEGQRLVAKLKELLPSQLFSVPLQAVISGKIIARETIGAKRRDVIAPLYGGDYTRKRKLLEQQKKGKEKLAGRGQLKIPSKVYLDMFKAQ